MSAIVEAYNNSGRDDYHPDAVFTEWVGQETFRCTTCARDFKTETLECAPEPQHEVTCSLCLRASKDGDDDYDGAVSALGALNDPA